MFKFIIASKTKKKAKHLLLCKIVDKFQILQKLNMYSSLTLSTLTKSDLWSLNDHT